MKKIEKVSIAGISFTLDADAYVSLKNYLDSLHKYYAKDPDGGEIIADIEARIAELILDEQIYTKIVSKELIDTIVLQLGSAEQIDDDVATEGAPAWSVGGSSVSGERIAKRLYRTRSPRILGGVCGGLANYFNINVGWIRVLFLLPFLVELLTLSWGGWMETVFDDPLGVWQSTFFIAYVILWIVVPMARTPRQNLEARGERVTADSIRQSFNSAAETPIAKRANSVAAEVLIVFGRIVLFFVKVVAACVAFGFIVAGMVVFVGLLGLIFCTDVIVMGSAVAMLVTISPWLTGLILFCVMLPLFAIGFELMGFVFGWRAGRVGKIAKVSLLGIWFVALVAALSIAASNRGVFRDAIENGEFLDGNGSWNFNWHFDNNEGWRFNGPGHLSNDDDRQERWRKEIRIVPAPEGAEVDSLMVEAPQTDSVVVAPVK